MWTVEVEGNPIVAYALLVVFIVLCGGCLWVTATRRYQGSDSTSPWWQRLLASGWAEAAGLLGFPVGVFGLSVAVLVEALGQQSGVTGWSIGAAAVATTLIWVLGVRQRTPRTVARREDALQERPGS